MHVCTGGWTVLGVSTHPLWPRSHCRTGLGLVLGSLSGSAGDGEGHSGDQCSSLAAFFALITGILFLLSCSWCCGAVEVFVWRAQPGPVFWVHGGVLFWFVNLLTCVLSWESQRNTD